MESQGNSLLTSCLRTGKINLQPICKAIPLNLPPLRLAWDNRPKGFLAVQPLSYYNAV